MILFFGTRPGKRISKTLPGIACPHCAERHTLLVHEQPNYFHLFWIPLFTVGTQQFAECTHCKKGFYKEEFTEEMKTMVNLDSHLHTRQ